MKILLGDFNAKVGREDIFKPTIGNETKNLRVKSTMFPHCNIHTYTWMSPDGRTHNQIDHILVDRRRQTIREIRKIQAK
jgi:endonuclease/exonuclease/phosphatase family metal-dependent hydrolase